MGVGPVKSTFGHVKVVWNGWQFPICVARWPNSLLFVCVCVCARLEHFRWEFWIILRILISSQTITAHIIIQRSFCQQQLRSRKGTVVFISKMVKQLMMTSSRIPQPSIHALFFSFPGPSHLGFWMQFPFHNWSSFVKWGIPFEKPMFCHYIFPMCLYLRCIMRTADPP